MDIGSYMKKNVAGYKLSTTFRQTLQQLENHEIILRFLHWFHYMLAESHHKASVMIYQFDSINRAHVKMKL